MTLLVKLIRTTLAVAVVAGLSSLGQVLAAEGEVQRLVAEDGHPVVITYYAAGDGKRGGGTQDTPVVILLHGAEKGRIAWDKMVPRAETGGVRQTFIDQLLSDGFAVVTVDLRKFGESVFPGESTTLRGDDYEKMSAGDLMAVKRFLFTLHQDKQINMSKMAIIAAGPTAPVAINFAAFDWMIAPYDDAPVLQNRTPRGQDVRALVLLSPDSSAGRLQAAKGLGVIRNPLFGIGMLVISGQQDAKDKGQSKKIFDSMAAPQRKGENRVYHLTPALKDRELGLMGKAPDQIEEPIRVFLKKHVKDIPVEWRDRKSKVSS